MLRRRFPVRFGRDWIALKTMTRQTYVQEEAGSLNGVHATDPRRMNEAKPEEGKRGP